MAAKQIDIESQLTEKRTFKPAKAFTSKAHISSLDAYEKLYADSIKRPDKFGGNVIYNNYESLEADYLSKKLHPMDLKNAVAEEVNKLLEPIRQKMKGKEDLVRNAFPH